MTEDGYLSVVDRKKDMIKTGGENVAVARGRGGDLRARRGRRGRGVRDQPPARGSRRSRPSSCRRPASALTEDDVHAHATRAAGRATSAQVRRAHRRAAEEPERQDPQARAAGEARRPRPPTLTSPGDWVARFRHVCRAPDVVRGAGRQRRAAATASRNEVGSRPSSFARSSDGSRNRPSAMRSWTNAAGPERGGVDRAVGHRRARHLGDGRGQLGHRPQRTAQLVDRARVAVPGEHGGGGEREVAQRGEVDRHALVGAEQLTRRDDVPQARVDQRLLVEGVAQHA